MKTTISDSRYSNSGFDVIALGLNAVDNLFEMDAFPREDSKVNFRSWRRLPGGQAATAACVASRLGFKAAYIGAVADDENGRFAIEEFRRDRVDLSHLLVRKKSVSQFACILVNRRNGSRTILWNKGPEIAVRPGELDFRFLRRARIFHCDGHNIPAELKAARFCRRHGIVTTIDTENGDPVSLRRLLRQIDHIIIPEDAVDRILGRRQRDSLSRCRSLLRLGARAVALTRGARGSVGYDGCAFVEVPALQVKAVDTTGAGDVFHGAYIAGLLFGLDLFRRLKFANYVAAVKCRHFGARGGAPTLAALRGPLQREFERYTGITRLGAG